MGIYELLISYLHINSKIFLIHEGFEVRTSCTIVVSDFRLILILSLHAAATFIKNKKKEKIARFQADDRDCSGDELPTKQLEFFAVYSAKAIFIISLILIPRPCCVTQYHVYLDDNDLRCFSGTIKPGCVRTYMHAIHVETRISLVKMITATFILSVSFVYTECSKITGYRFR